MRFRAVGKCENYFISIFHLMDIHLSGVAIGRNSAHADDVARNNYPTLPEGRHLAGIWSSALFWIAAAFIGSPKSCETGRQDVEMLMITGVISLDLLSNKESKKLGEKID